MLNKPTSVTHHSFLIERTYPYRPEAVFAAFANPEKKRRWFAEDRGQPVEAFEMDFRPGGRERASFRYGEGHPVAGAVITNDGVYLDIVPNRRIVAASSMALREKPFSASLATFEFQPASGGTLVVFTHQGAFFEGADGPKMREAGWSKLFEQLERELAR